MLKMLRDGVEVEILTEKVSEKHNDSFWYDDVIANLRYKDREIKIMACGEIRIQNKEGELVHDGFKSRNSGIDLQNDDDLKKIGYNYDDDYYWENNNWFDFLFKNSKMKNFESVLGQVAHDYDEALEMGINWIKDEEWWKKNEDLEKRKK